MLQGGVTAYLYVLSGNGITTEKFFNDFGMVEDIIANGVMEHTYGWDAATGNLDWRADQMGGLIEEFDYDALDRLKEAQVDNETPLTVLYANNGNIELKSDVGEYTYLEDKVNAVRTVTNPDEEISLVTQDVHYTTFDRTADITEGLHKAVFHYGPAQDRRKMEMIDLATNDVVAYRYYAGPYEEMHLADGNTYKLHYISGGDGLAAIHVVHVPATGATVAQTFFVYKDHLGSIIALTDESGDVVHRQSFDAWGKRRNPDNWTYDFTGFSQPTLSDPNMPDPTIWLNRGYTGHEHLDEFALINMNNRMYDPEQGRMLAVDNFVQDPFSTQGYNRYSYAGNNPLKYIDPTGEIAVVPLMMVSFFVGAVIEGWANQGDPGEIMGAATTAALASAVSASVGGSGVPMANTLGIMSGSMVNSIGRMIYSDDKSGLVVSVGVASYNLNSGAWGYLGKKGNAWYEDMGYAFGAIANFGDAVSLFGGGGQNINVNSASTKDGNEWWGHSSITDENGKSLVSVGPDTQVEKAANISDTWRNSIKVADTDWNTYLGKDGTWSVELNNVSTNAIAKYASSINRWDLLLNSCVGHTAKALWSAGIPNIYAFHPHMLNLQLAILQIGIYSSPYLHKP